MLTLCCMTVGAQSRVARKTTATKTRTVAKKPTGKTTTVSSIVVNDPVFIEGHLAFQGTSLNADGNTLLDRLYATGKYTNMEHSAYSTGGSLEGKWHGGKEISISVSDYEIFLKEKGTLSKSAAIARIKSLANAYQKAGGGRLKVEVDRYVIYYANAVIQFDLEPLSYDLSNNKYYVCATFNDKP